MNALVFACALRLRDDFHRDELLLLLPAQTRTEVEAALEQTAGMSAMECGRRLHAHRLEQCSGQRRDAGMRTGIAMDLIAPKLAAWLARPF